MRQLRRAGGEASRARVSQPAERVAPVLLSASGTNCSGNSGTFVSDWLTIDRLALINRLSRTNHLWPKGLSRWSVLIGTHAAPLRIDRNSVHPCHASEWGVSPERS